MEKLENAFSLLEELKRTSVIRMKSELENTKNKSEKEIRKSFYGYLRSSPQTRTIMRFIEEISDEDQKLVYQNRLNEILTDGIIG